MSYVSLLSTIPLIVIFVLELKNFRFYPVLKDRLMRGISNYFLPEKAQHIVRYIDSVIESTKSIGFIGILFSFTIAFLLTFTLSKTINHIWRKHTTRALLLNAVKFIIIIISAPLFIVTTFYLQNFVSLPGRGRDISVLILPRINAALFLSLVLHWFLLTVLYTLIPHGKVKVLYASIAGIFSGTCWFFLRLGLNVYVKFIPHIHILYGSLAFLPILLMWLYLSWIIVLFGVELNYTFHFDLG